MNVLKQFITTKQVFTLLIYAVIVLDVAYRVHRQNDAILSWQLVTVLGVLTFVTLGDRISEFIVGKEGITLRQSLDTQVQEVARDAADLQLINETGDTRYVDRLLDRAKASERDLLSKIIIYRLTLRALLREICKLHGMTLRDSQGFGSMLSFLEEKNLLGSQLATDLNFIRCSTFFFEWGNGHLPTTEDIKQVLEKSPQVIKALEYMLPSRSSAR